jgi:hypothetical protein
MYRDVPFTGIAYEENDAGILVLRCDIEKVRKRVSLGNGQKTGRC